MKRFQPGDKICMGLLHTYSTVGEVSSDGKSWRNEWNVGKGMWLPTATIRLRSECGQHGNR